MGDFTGIWGSNSVALPTYSGSTAGRSVGSGAGAGAGAGGVQCCPTYWNRAQYVSIRVKNPVNGGNFAIDTPTIRPSFYWFVLAASMHFEWGSPTWGGWYLCPDTAYDRAVVPTQNLATNPQPQGTGIALGGSLGVFQSNLGNSNNDMLSAQEFGLPFVPLIIPNGFFLRAITLMSNNTPPLGTIGEVRLCYIELAVDDPGPIFP